MADKGGHIYLEEIFEKIDSIRQKFVHLERETNVVALADFNFFDSAREFALTMWFENYTEQQRSENIVSVWKERIEGGHNPPILVEAIGGDRPHFAIYDGFHKLTAYEQLGIDFVWALVA